jgi:hypothetical protein
MARQVDMSRRRLLAASLLWGVAVFPAAGADGALSPVPIAVLDLVYVDTSGEPRDQT